MSGDFFEGSAQTSVMERDRLPKISGGALRRLRNSLRLTQRELGDKIGLTESRVRAIERSDSTGVYPEAWRKLMELTGKTLPQLEALLVDTGEPDLNVEPYSEKPFEPFPIFDLPVAAGTLTAMPEVEEMHGPQTHAFSKTYFAVRIRGDSMEKKYPDGSLILFRCLTPETAFQAASKLEVGRDYYVQAAECATFKKLVAFDETALTFKAINKRKYPNEIKVLRADISRMAMALYILGSVED